MMFYPLNLYKTDINPLFKGLSGAPYIFDFSSNNPKIREYTPSDFNTFNKQIFDEIEGAGHTWGIGRYLEDRTNLLQDYPQYIAEGRVYHLGLDIAVPFGTPLYSPLGAEVVKVGKEEDVGSYGGYIMLKHVEGDTTFYTFFGHLQTPHIHKVGDVLKAGELLAHIGKESDSGQWFCHTHLQVLTQKAVDEGLTNVGYVTPEFLKKVDEYFPSPYHLFKV